MSSYSVWNHSLPGTYYPLRHPQPEGALKYSAQISFADASGPYQASATRSMGSRSVDASDSYQASQRYLSHHSQNFRDKKHPDSELTAPSAASERIM
jgi:hypothetical protein